jgi:hypothetical protein
MARRSGKTRVPAAPPWRRRALGAALALAVNLLAGAALLWRAASPPAPVPPGSVVVSLAPRPPGPALAREDLGAFEPVRPAMPQAAAPAIVMASPAQDTSDILSEAQIAGAAHAGEGGGGGGCDTARLVQQALRRDPMVRLAVDQAHRRGQAIMLWNGDWVQSGAEDGKGLSVVREAILWEVGFAPTACRDQPVHGMVLLSLADGGTRFAIGAGNWRWSDLLGLRLR